MLNRLDGFKAVDMHDVRLKMAVPVFSECAVGQELFIYIFHGEYLGPNIPTKLHVGQPVPFLHIHSSCTGAFFF